MMISRNGREEDPVANERKPDQAVREEEEERRKIRRLQWMVDMVLSVLRQDPGLTLMEASYRGDEREALERFFFSGRDAKELSGCIFTADTLCPGSLQLAQINCGCPAAPMTTPTEGVMVRVTVSCPWPLPLCSGITDAGTFLDCADESEQKASSSINPIEIFRRRCIRKLRDESRTLTSSAGVHRVFIVGMGPLITLVRGAGKMMSRRQL